MGNSKDDDSYQKNTPKILQKIILNLISLLNKEVTHEQSITSFFFKSHF